MNLNEYQKGATETFIKGQKDLDLARLTLGLSGESGEVAEKVKKALRGDKPLENSEMTNELGDVMWYVAVLAHHLGIELEDIGKANLSKLKSRKERGVIKGDGDNR